MDKETKTMPAFIVEAEEEQKVRFEKEYGAAVTAIDQLFEMAQKGDKTPEKIKSCVDAIETGKRHLQDRVLDPNTFCAVAEKLVSLAQVKDLYWRQGFHYDPGINEESDMAGYLLIGGLRSFGQKPSQLNHGQARIVLDSIGVVLRGNYDYGIKTGRDFLAVHADELKALGKNVEDGLNQLEEYLRSKEFEMHLAYIVDDSLRLRRTLNVDRVENADMLRDIIKRYGLPADKVLGSWLSGESWLRKDAEVSPPAIHENILIMQQLEEARKGAVGFLYQNFGIRNFNRYPPELLIKQVDEYQKLDKPYGILVEPTVDHNGSFLEETELLEKLSAQLGDDYALRIMECGGKWDVVSKLLLLNGVYGDRRKISFAIIAGHGNGRSITLGGYDLRQHLHIDQLASGKAKDIRDIFVENPVFVLFSCFAGIKKGIGQEASKELGATVIASDESTSPKSINVRKENGKIGFEVEYQKGSTKIFVKGEEQQ